VSALVDQLRTANTHDIANGHYALLDDAAEAIETLAGWLLSPLVYVHESIVDKVDAALIPYVGTAGVHHE
jgi:hypothetical protein